MIEKRNNRWYKGNNTPSPKTKETTAYKGQWNYKLPYWNDQGKIIRHRRLTHTSLRSQPFLLALRHWERFAQRNVCDSTTEFHTDDVNQCLHNKSGNHGIPNASLFNFTYLLVDYGKVLRSSENKLQQNSNACSSEDYIPQILTVLLEIHRV